MGVARTMHDGPHLPKHQPRLVPNHMQLHQSCCLCVVQLCVSGLVNSLCCWNVNQLLHVPITHNPDAIASSIINVAGNVVNSSCNSLSSALSAVGGSAEMH